MNPLPDNIVLFDGACGLCTASVRFILRRDHRAVFCFAPLQSETGRQLCVRHGLDPQRFESVVLVRRDRVQLRSDAALAIVRELGGAWCWLAVLGVVPRPLRDWLYGVVSRNRHRWFGRYTACLATSGVSQNRFLP